MGVLDSEKEIALTGHLAFRWARRVANQLSIDKAEEKEIVIKRLKRVLKTREYALIHDGKEYNHKKYRLVCELWGELLTFVVIDAHALVFKTVWPAKKWEVKKLEDEMSNM